MSNDKLSNMGYPEFMNTVYEYQKGNWYNRLCDKCGGTGFVPMMCCGGDECGCLGLPVDFDIECSVCGRKGDISND